MSVWYTRSRDGVRTSKRVNGDEHTTDIRVDLPIRPPLLQVLVDALVGDRREQSHIRHSDLLLLESLLPIGLWSRSSY